MKSIKIMMMAVLTITTVTVFAQSKAGKKDTTRNTVFYTCSMHPEVMMKKEGQCPEYGMKLTLSKKEQLKQEVVNNFACPVHTNFASNKAGQCPACGMNMNLSPKEKMKTGTMTNFTCPMHADVVSTKSGKCPQCRMNLSQGKKKTKPAEN